MSDQARYEHLLRTGHTLPEQHDHLAPHARKAGDLIRFEGGQIVVLIHSDEHAPKHTVWTCMVVKGNTKGSYLTITGERVGVGEVVVL